MQSASETVGALAVALAKAQMSLSIRRSHLSLSSARKARANRAFAMRRFRAGLRSCVGRHEIATVQTTSIDQAVSLVNLTTMLVHASGEWIASDWPVCPITDIASPRRMGLR
jgi:hypothetical protein